MQRIVNFVLELDKLKGVTRKATFSAPKKRLQLSSSIPMET